jgi:16S rRNA (adenine1518-N6/adenine1519-N6)-dimethyltransferase
MAAGPRRIADVVRSHGLRPRKALGQHFIHDPAILARIAQAAGPLEGATVLEVGPGPGGLTQALLAAGAGRVVAIDKDPRCIRALAGLAALSEGRLVLIEGDARELDPAAVAGGEPIRIVANLPYNVGTELLLFWFEHLESIRDLTLLFQKEVALRLTAPPGTTDYGRLAVMAQRLCRVERLFDLPPGAFVPPPKVTSSLVRLTPRTDRPSPLLRERLAEVTRAAFGQRRKMLRASLKTLGVEPLALLAAAGITPTRRAESLTIAEFCRLAEVLNGLREGRDAA